MTCGSEKWNESEQVKVIAMEMSDLRATEGVTRRDRVRNEAVRGLFGIAKKSIGGEL